MTNKLETRMQEIIDKMEQGKATVKDLEELQRLDKELMTSDEYLLNP